MKKLCRYFGNQLWNILAIISLSIICQLSTLGQTCTNVPVTYYAGITPDGVGYWPNTAYNRDGTKPLQQSDGNHNLIVTWPYPEQGDVYYYSYDGQYPWAENEIVNVVGPSFVTAPSGLCNSQAGTFTISDVCGTSFTWAAPTGWSINGGGNVLTTSSQSVNITAPSTGIGNAQISATSNLATTVIATVTTNVWLGQPVFNSISIDGSTSPVPLCGGGNYISYAAGQAHVLSTSVSGTPSVTFVLSGAGVTGSALSATSYEFTSSSSTTNFTITATVSNSCRTISQCLPFYNVSSGGGGSGGGGGGGGGCSSYTVSPNPSNGTLRVIVPDMRPPCNSTTQLSTNLSSSPASSSDSETSGNENTLTIQSVSLYSLGGQPQFTKQFSGNTKSVDLDISGLKKGVYILRISDGVSRNEAQRIVIN